MVFLTDADYFLVFVFEELIQPVEAVALHAFRRLRLPANANCMNLGGGAVFRSSRLRPKLFYCCLADWTIRCIAKKHLAVPPYIADFSVLNYIRASVPDHFGGAASDWLSRAERLHDIFSGSRGPEGLPLKRAE